MNEKPSFKKSINQIPLPIGKIKKNPASFSKIIKLRIFRK